MKPFNLEEAIAGKPLVTRNGNKVTEFHYFESIADPFKCHFVVAGHISSATESGKYYTESEHHLDLFMAPTKKSGWINIYKNQEKTTTGISIYSTEEVAKNVAALYTDYVATIYIEWEE